MPASSPDHETTGEDGALKVLAWAVVVEIGLLGVALLVFLALI